MEEAQRGAGDSAHPQRDGGAPSSTVPTQLSRLAIGEIVGGVSASRVKQTAGHRIEDGSGPSGQQQAGAAAADGPRRPRSRQDRRQQQPAAAGSTGSQATGSGRRPPPAAAGGALPGLTWQQEQFLSAAAAPYVPEATEPGQQQQAGQRRERVPRAPGRGGGAGGRGAGSSGRGRGRGRGDGGSDMPPLPSETEWEQWQQGQFAGVQGRAAGASSAAPEADGGAAFARQQQPQQQQVRPLTQPRPPRQRRPERTPHSQQQQQHPQGNDQQQQQQAEGERGQLPFAEGMAAAAAAPQQQRRPSPPAAAGADGNTAAPQESRRKQRQQQQQQRRERGVPQRSDPSANGSAAAGGAATGAPGVAPPPLLQREPQNQQQQVATDAAAAAPQPPPSQPLAQAAEAEAPHCLVCCSAMAEVGLGACNHKEVCGQCTLRLRLCYNRHDCPLCKAELKEVIIVPWRAHLPDWEFFQQNPDCVARTVKWAKGEIWADRWRRSGRPSSRLLHDLQRRTALACSVCDRGGEAPFAHREHLLRHVQEEHDLRLCGLCLQEGRLFPLELEAFPTFAALQAHSSAAHPHCAFCRRTFYDDDELWKHMHQVHHSCHVCPPPAASHAYFNRASDLMQHMRKEHHMCEDPECADCFVAFETAEELRRHSTERHSARMPRWDSSRARTMQLDLSYNRRQGLEAAQQPGRRERQQQQHRARGSQDVRLVETSNGGEQQQQQGAAAAAAGQWPSDYAHEADGGLLIIDDAEFPAAAAAYAAGRGGTGGGGGGRGGSSFLPPSGRPGRQQQQQQQRQQQQSRRADDFPSLSAAAAATATGDSSSSGAPGGSGGGGSSSFKAPPLVKRTMKCPCGRRVSHYAVAEGQELPPLECDAVCRLEGRRRQLADAFDVDNPADHASYWERQKAATYSGLLLAAAQQHPRFIEGLEQQLATFVADKAAKRESLSSMTREQRQVVHQLAQQYGVATSSYGQEPGRYIELFKTPGAGIPARLLSRVAPTVPADEVAALLKEGEGHAMRLTDIAMSVDIRFYLRQWEGACSFEWQGGDAAVVRFEREQDLKEALDVLGGGIRGLFRIDRSWRPKTAVAAAAPSSSGGGGGSRGWAGGADGGAGESGSGSASWTAIAVAPRPIPGQEAQPSAAAAEQHAAGGSGIGRWAVMSGRRAVRPAAAAAAAAGGGAGGRGGGGSRNLLAEMVPEEADVVTSDDDSSDSDRD